MNVRIVPSIIAERLDDIKVKLDQLEGLVEWAQIDVVDGLFALPQTWPYKLKEEPTELRRLTHGLYTTKLEVHLMIENPESEIDRWLSSGADRVIFHFEATPRVNELIAKCESPRFGVNGHSRLRVYKPGAAHGIALKIETPPEVLEHFAEPPRFVQLMSIDHMGGYGAPFDDAVYAKIEYVRKKFPRTTISVDGGVSMDNMRQLMAAGANQLVVGSAIWKSASIKDAIRMLRANM